MRNAALAFIEALVGCIEHIRELRRVLAVIVPRHSGNRIPGVRSRRNGPHPQQQFTTAYAGV
jgi:hypothetical protein